MFTPVQIEKDDIICINVVTNTVWLEKKTSVQSGCPALVPEHPDLERGTTKRHFPARKLFKGMKDETAWNVAYTLAYTIAWVAGLSIGDDTDNYLQTRDTYVFKVV